MKKVFYGIIILVVLYFVLALFGPTEVKVERSIVINAPPALVNERLGDLNYFHEQWSPWTELDPAMKYSLSGEAGMPGHSYKWSGNKEVGTGELIIIRHNADSLVQTLRFDDQGDAMAYYLVNGEGSNTRVTWGMYFEVGYMYRTPMLFMDMNELIGRDYEKGLMRFKQAVEKENTSGV